MSKKAPSAPAAPDPVATTNAQYNLNEKTAEKMAELNRVSQYTPWGSSTWQQVGATPAVTKRMWVDSAGNKYDAMPTPTAGTGRRWVSGGTDGGGYWDDGGGSPALNGSWQDVEMSPAKGGAWQQTVSLNPQDQALLDQQRDISGRLYGVAGTAVDRVKDTLGQGIDLSGLPDLTQDFSADRDKVQQALLARLQPQMDQKRQALAAQLANQGISLGSEAWRNGQDDFARQENDLNLAAVAQAGQEQQRLQQQALATRQQGIQERAYLRNLPLQDVATLMGTGGSVSMPQFGAVPQVGMQSPDYQGAANTAYQGELAQYNAQRQSNNAMMGGLFGLGGAALGGWGSGGFKKFW